MRWCFTKRSDVPVRLVHMVLNARIANTSALPGH